MKRLLGLLFLAVVLQSIALAYAAPTPTPSPTPSLKLDIVPKFSRSPLTAGSGFGLNADITNKSSVPVFIVPRYTTMSPPPELDPGTPTFWPASIPGATSPELEAKQWTEPVRLGPGSSIPALWAGGQKRADDTHWWGFLRLLSFVPGEYAIKINVLYWTDENDARNARSNFESLALETKAPIVPPQWVILAGAIIGGIIAYFLLPNVRIRPQRVEIWGLLTAALLSSIVTIILARISETQFLVRVTVNDVWGAIAMGFITSASGVSILNRYLPKPSGTSGKDDQKSESDLAKEAGAGGGRNK